MVDQKCKEQCKSSILKKRKPLIQDESISSSGQQLAAFRILGQELLKKKLKESFGSYRKNFRCDLSKLDEGLKRSLFNKVKSYQEQNQKSQSDSKEVEGLCTKFGVVAGKGDDQRMKSLCQLKRVMEKFLKLKEEFKTKTVNLVNPGEGMLVGVLKLEGFLDDMSKLSRTDDDWETRITQISRNMKICHGLLDAYEAVFILNEFTKTSGENG